MHKVRLNDLAKDHQVEYTFQKKGWLDIPTTIWYAENIAIPYVNTDLRDSEDEWVLLVLDASGNARIHPAVKKVFGDAKILMWFGEPNMSHRIAVIDRSIGNATRSVAVREGLGEWLEEKGNRKRWTRKRISAQTRRELSIGWVGDAWQKLSSRGRSTGI